MVSSKGTDFNPFISGLLQWVSPDPQEKLHKGNWKRNIRKHLMNTTAEIGKTTKGRNQKKEFFFYNSVSTPFFQFLSYHFYFQPLQPWEPLGGTFPCFSSPPTFLPILLPRAKHSALYARRPLELSTNAAFWYSRASTIHLELTFPPSIPLTLSTELVHNL